MARKRKAADDVFNAKRVVSTLRRASLKGKVQLQLDVGYSAKYAKYVHENLAANHPRGGQAKFLEQPARQLRGEMRAIVQRSVEAKNGLEEGLRRSGELLLARSRELVPVDTGYLKRSGYVRIK